MNKVVLKMEVYDDKIKKKAMKSISSLSGVESVSVDMKDQKLTLIGDIDPVLAVGKLRKLCHTEILSVGPDKEPEKQEDENEKPEEEEKKKDQDQNFADIVKVSQVYHYHHYLSVEENPNACVIC